MTVRELNAEQLLELKVKYIFERFEEYGTTPSYKDVAESEGIPDGLIFLEYDGVDFVEEDFVYRDDENEQETTNIEEEKEMKKYTLKDYKKFCDEALIVPPFEDDEHINEWFDTHKIQIIANGCMMELDYDADAVNEIDFSLREIHRAILGDGEATTGNTVGNEYRQSELKDVVRYFIMCRYENWGGLNWFDYANQALVEMCDITSVIGVYEQARKIEKNIDFECNWHNFKIESLKDATEEGVKKIILDWVGSNIEISYDEHTDKSFIIDYTFKESGDFIDWAWGNINDDELKEILTNYKAQIFEN